ncbi:MAG: phosphonate ABC transporter, permease protein PhnE [Proteobacteria bacterium]|nr:phosphonate ABC transporter, permease protein PhnE [Pseudomonadota bacterium]
MTTTTLSTPRDSVKTWSHFKYPQSLIKYGIMLIILVFIAISIKYLNIHLERVLTMFGRLGNLFANRYYPPDIPYILDSEYLGYVFETVKMAYLGALFGILLAIPLSWFASFNMTPNKRFLYPVARFLLMICRAVHEMIWTILLVTIIGFGMLPGVIALSLFSLGFTGKLFSEEIEAINQGQVEAIQATGANPLKVFVYAVLPQVRVAWTGISIYTWDAAFRAATVVGFFGAGGMGWYLRRTVQQVESNRVAAILISIVALVIISEVASAWARNKVSKT